MEVSKALLERRTIRKFTQEPIAEKDLLDLIEYARLAAYPANLQPLKFAVVRDKDLCNEIFPNTKWAAYLPNGSGTPEEEHRPTAYIMILGDKSIKNSFEVEAGAAITSMMLGAWEKGIASCWFGSLNRGNIMNILNLSEDEYSLVYVLALGYPAQESQISEMKDNDVKYYVDENNNYHVPKRSMEEILVVNK